jgi:hypothetical protein
MSENQKNSGELKFQITGLSFKVEDPAFVATGDLSLLKALFGAKTPGCCMGGGLPISAMAGMLMSRMSGAAEDEGESPDPTAEAANCTCAASPASAEKTAEVKRSYYVTDDDFVAFVKRLSPEALRQAYEAETSNEVRLLLADILLAQ